jgi:hypothetical protein
MKVSLDFGSDGSRGFGGGLAVGKGVACGSGPSASLLTLTSRTRNGREIVAIINSNRKRETVFTDTACLITASPVIAGHLTMTNGGTYQGIKAGHAAKRVSVPGRNFLQTVPSRR